MNAVIIAWVNVALGSLLQVFFNIPADQVIFYLAGAMFFVMIYSSLAGLLGVVMTDFIQFILAMIGSIVLAVIVLNSDQIGGISGLQAKLPAATFEFFPTFAETTEVFTISFATFLAFVGVQWWASWYPGSEPGGGGYIAQPLRPWPWIIVGLCAIVLYPELSADEKRLGYAMAMRDKLGYQLYY